MWKYIIVMSLFFTQNNANESEIINIFAGTVKALQNIFKSGCVFIANNQGK